MAELLARRGVVDVAWGKAFDEAGFRVDQPKPRILHLPILRPQSSAFKRWFSNLIRWAEKIVRPTSRCVL